MFHDLFNGTVSGANGRMISKQNGKDVEGSSGDLIWGTILQRDHKVWHKITKPLMTTSILA
jgi:hypothetical protein